LLLLLLPLPPLPPLPLLLPRTKLCQVSFPTLATCGYLPTASANSICHVVVCSRRPLHV